MVIAQKYFCGTANGLQSEKCKENQEGMKSGAKQEGGTHYLEMGIQPWQVIDANGLNYYEGCAIKYIMRRKPGQDRVTELKKAIHYLEHLIELEENKKAASQGDGFK